MIRNPLASALRKVGAVKTSPTAKRAIFNFRANKEEAKLIRALVEKLAPVARAKGKPPYLTSDILRGAVLIMARDAADKRANLPGILQDIEAEL